MDINLVFDKLFNFYKITSLSELAEKLGVTQPALSQWKTRNSINAVKKKCRELGIYNEIFDELNINISNEVEKKIKKDDVDEATYSLFKEAYKTAKSKDDIMNFRLLLMEYSFKLKG